MVLSICIPTYNQPKSVERLLGDLYPQITPDVEILIRDDSTNDETEAIVRRYGEKTAIRYIRGKKEGLDKTIIFLTKEARGEYVWWLGDDTIEKGAVEAVIKCVTKNPDIDFVCLNNREKTNNTPALQLGGDRFFRDANEVLEEVVDLLGFISITIFKRARALSGIPSAEKHIGSAFVNLYLILHVLSQKGKYYFISYPYVVSEPRPAEKPAWYDGFSVFAVNLYNIVREFDDRFDRHSIKRMLADNFDGIWKGIIVYRAKGYAHGLGSKEPKLPILAKLYWNFAGFWIALPLLALPRGVVRILYSAYKTIKKN